MSVLLFRGSGRSITVPASERKRGRWGIHRIYWLWPKARKHTLEEAITHLIEHWED